MTGNNEHTTPSLMQHNDTQTCPTKNRIIAYMFSSQIKIQQSLVACLISLGVGLLVSLCVCVCVCVCVHVCVGGGGGLQIHRIDYKHYK